MRVLVTGSSGHLGEGLVRTLRSRGDDVVGVDLRPGAFTDRVGSLCDREFVRSVVDVDTVIHAATLHKPHVFTHGKAEFVNTNVLGTLNLLEEAVKREVGSFVYTSTTSVFGRALTPAPDEPAAWITERVVPEPKNIYGVTKLAAEQLCELAHREGGLACVILRTSRFFREEDDDRVTRMGFSDGNIKLNEYLYRRIDLEDAVEAHLLAARKAKVIGFDRFIVSATTPFRREQMGRLRADAPTALFQLLPEAARVYERLGWRMFPGIDRVYVNDKAREALDWKPRFDFHAMLGRAEAGRPIFSDLALAVGSKGYHEVKFRDGPYPVADR